MKIAKFVLYIGIVFIGLNMVSCNNEPLDPAVNLKPSSVIPTNPTTPTNPGNTAIIANPCGDYYPLVKDNSWDFYNGTISKNLKITAVESYGGTDFYKINKNYFMTNQTTYVDADYTTHFRKSAGEYFMRIFVNKPEVYTPRTGAGTVASPYIPESSIAGVVIQPYEVIFLKDALAVNDSFTQVIPLAITRATTSTTLINSVPTLGTSYVSSTQNLEVTITLVEKNLTAIVNGYATTILKTKTVTVGVPGYQYNWYAKDIGLIEQTNVNATGVVTDYLKLTAFSFY